MHFLGFAFLKRLPIKPIGNYLKRLPIKPIGNFSKKVANQANRKL